VTEGAILNDFPDLTRDDIRGARLCRRA